VKIVTEYVYPPIPIRRFDWLAYYDGMEEGVTGTGATEAEAIADLIENNDAGGPTEEKPNRAYCKPDQSCCDFCCGN
jgi:hypothetical protein